MRWLSLSRAARHVSSTVKQPRPGGRLDMWQASSVAASESAMRHALPSAHQDRPLTKGTELPDVAAVVGAEHKLNGPLGDLTDELDSLEHDPSVADFEDRLAEARKSFEEWLCLHKQTRATVSGKQRMRFDHWFRPRAREVENWFWVVEDKRKAYHSNVQRSRLKVEAMRDKYVGMAEKAADSSSAGGTDEDVVPQRGGADPNAPALVSDELSLLERRAEVALDSMSNVDMYRLWRLKGRPTGTDTVGPLREKGAAERPIPMPGYHAPRRLDSGYSP